MCEGNGFSAGRQRPNAMSASLPGSSPKAVASERASASVGVAASLVNRSTCDGSTPALTASCPSGMPLARAVLRTMSPKVSSRSSLTIMPPPLRCGPAESIRGPDSLGRSGSWRAATARGRLEKRDDDHCGDEREPEHERRVLEACRERLRVQSARKRCQRLLRRGDRIGAAARDKTPGDLRQLSLCDMGILRDRFTEALEMITLAVDQERRQNGDAERTAERAREIEERRTVGALVRFERGERDGADRGEHQGQRRAADDLD